MEKTTLYKLDSKGKVRVWHIWVENEGTHSIIYVESGLRDGKSVVTPLPVYLGKNVGKANATNHYTQALAEMQSKIESQLRSGYVQNIDDVKQFTLRSGIATPMLAQKYHPTGAIKSSKTLEKMKIMGKTIWMQPKYDGNRCMIKVTPTLDQQNDCIGAQAVMYTRKGDVMIQLPHLIQEIEERAHEINLRKEIVLDGELFSDVISFSTLNGLLRKEDKTPERKEQAETIHYRVYDNYNELAWYKDRYNLIKLFAKNMKNVLLTPYDEIVATDENIAACLNKYLAEGHEGGMIRRLDMPYEHKRSWGLVKVKLFDDKEFKLVGMEEDKRGGLVGNFILAMDVEAYDGDGKLIPTFKAGTSGLSHEESREMWQNREKYIGMLATVVFQPKRSDYNVPIFGKVKGFRSDV